MIKLKLKKGLSYCGVVSATKEHPYVDVENEAAAKLAVASGYFEVVSSGTNAPNSEPATGAVTKLDVMTVAQLRDYAKENGIDLAGATKKEEILSVIENALNSDDSEELFDDNEEGAESDEA